MNDLLVDIEFAHMDMAPLDLAIEEEEIIKSSIYASELTHELTKKKIEWTTSVLVDDKRSEHSLINVGAALSRITPLSGSVPIHRTLLERHLTFLKDDFISLFDHHKRSDIKNDFDRYQASRDGRMGCSQDIAVWTAVRFGLISASTLCDRIQDTARHGFSKESKPDVLVSILPARYKPYEERASQNYLRHLGRGKLSQNIFRLYFNQSYAQKSQKKIDDILTKILGKAGQSITKLGD